MDMIEDYCDDIKDLFAKARQEWTASITYGTSDTLPGFPPAP